MGLYDKMKNQNQPANNSVMAKPAEGSFTFTFIHCLVGRFKTCINTYAVIKGISTNDFVTFCISKNIVAKVPFFISV